MKEQKVQPKPKEESVSFMRGDIVSVKGIRTQIIKITGNTLTLKILGDRSKVRMVR